MPLRPLWPTAAMHPLLSRGRQPVGAQLADLPASSVRDLAAAENPVDQWGRPFQPELRATGQQLAEGNLGMEPGWGSAGVGLGLEALMDPLAWAGAGFAKGAAPGLQRALRPTGKLAAGGLGAMLAKPGVSQVMESARLSDALAPTGPAVGAMGMGGPPPTPKVEVPFYSRLVRAAENLPGEKIKSQSLLNQLKKAPEGFSMEEYQWSGVEDFIKDKPVIKKSELLKHLEENRPRVLTSTLTETPEVLRLKAREQELKRMTEAIDVNVPMDDPDLPRLEEDSLRTHRELFRVRNRLDEISPQWKSYAPAGGANYAEHRFVVEHPEIPEGYYQEQWWPEKNVMAHSRTQEMTTNSGEKMLLQIEDQSDPHQAAAKLGYEGGARGPLLQELDDLNREIKKLQESFVYPDTGTRKPWTEEGHANSKLLDKLQQELSDKKRVIQEVQRHANINIANEAAPLYGGRATKYGGQAPELPWKDKAWSELTAKRLLADAVESNAEVVAWQKGEDVASAVGGKKTGQMQYYDKDKINIFKKVLKQVGIDKPVEAMPYTATKQNVKLFTQKKTTAWDDIVKMATTNVRGSRPEAIDNTLSRAIGEYTNEYNNAVHDIMNRHGGLADVPMTFTKEELTPSVSDSQIDAVGLMTRALPEKGLIRSLPRKIQIALYVGDEMDPHVKMMVDRVKGKIPEAGTRVLTERQIADLKDDNEVRQVRDWIFQAITDNVTPVTTEGTQTRQTHAWGVRLTPEDRAKIAKKGLSFMGIAGAGAAAGLAQPQEQR